LAAEKHVNIVVVTGPESTGKTWLVQRLARHFNGDTVPEYAREYIGNLNRPYTYTDVESIAQQQVNDLEFAKKNTEKNYIFVDTYLEITRVWFLWKYNLYPEWIDKKLQDSNIPLYLLCNTDVEWIPDEVRENGGENRELLFEHYKKELIDFNIPYQIIRDTGENRLINAVNAINSSNFIR